MAIKQPIHSNQPLKYFIYCRKSSESEDKQILSLDAQEKELKEYAAKNDLRVVGLYRESKTAFKPGRGLFNEMLSRIEAGEAHGVLVWMPNRIARNSLDGGKFIYLMDEGKISELRTPYKTFTTSANDKFILNLEFGMAKKDSDEKSENVKRGNRYRFCEKKLWIGSAKPGYLNYTDPLTKEHTIITDPERFPLIQKAFRMLLTGSYTAMEALNELNNHMGYRSRKTRRQGGKPMSKSGFYRMIDDPYYFGLMVRKEGVEVGSHEPMIMREEFDRLQVMIGRRGSHFTRHEFPFKSVLRCGECGGSITCEEKWQVICPNCKTKFHRGHETTACATCKTAIEQMRNPTILHYVYYHCTKKAHPDCSQGCVELDTLEEQIDDTLKRFEIDEDFKTWAITYLNELNDAEVQDRRSYQQNLKKAYDDCSKKLDRLLELKISPQNADESQLSDDEYASKRNPLLEEKQALLQKINDADARQNNWLELSERTFEFARYARYWFANGDVKTKTQILAALGSNLTIRDKKLVIDGQNAFFLIEKGLEEVREVAHRLEPTKSIDELVQSGVVEPLRTAWQGCQDSNLEESFWRAP